MILYFSGTGNSAYVAKYIGSQIHDEVISINELMKKEESAELRSEKPFVFVTPTYAWRMPLAVEKFLSTCKFIGNKNAYYILTCGKDFGDSQKYASELSVKSGLEFKGLSALVMPNNYIMMNGVTDEETSIKIIKGIKPEIEELAEKIKNDERLDRNKVSLVDKLLSGPINNVFYKVSVNGKKFNANDKCIGCTKCEKYCPLNNIKMEDNRPVWSDNCTQCLACICICPTEAIEYGKATKGKRRYWCPNV